MTGISEDLTKATLIVDLINRHVEGAHVNEVHSKGGTTMIRVVCDSEEAWQAVLAETLPFLPSNFILVPLHRRKT